MQSWRLRVPPSSYKEPRVEASEALLCPHRSRCGTTERQTAAVLPLSTCRCKDRAVVVVVVAPGFFCLYPAGHSWCRLCFPSAVRPLKRLMGQAVMVCRWLSVKCDALVCLVVWQSGSESVQGGWWWCLLPRCPTSAGGSKGGGGASSDGGAAAASSGSCCFHACSRPLGKQTSKGREPRCCVARDGAAE